MNHRIVLPIALPEQYSQYSGGADDDIPPGHDPAGQEDSMSLSRYSVISLDRNLAEHDLRTTKIGPCMEPNG